MGKRKHRGEVQHLASRERQIMDAIYRLEEGSVAEIREALLDPPSYSAVRTMIRLLETKGFLKHRRDGVRYLYRPTGTKVTAQRSAMQHLMDVFFGGSAADAVAALLDHAGDQLSSDELNRLDALIDEKRDAD